MSTDRKIGLTRVRGMLMETFGLGPAVSLSAMLVVSLIIIFAVFWFFHSAPPHPITITSGPEGSIFEMSAEKYKKILARDGVNLKILPSEGSAENLKRLSDPSFSVDIGFVQGGVVGKMNVDKLVSLGSVSYEPLLVFYRSSKPLNLLSELNGKRIAIGPDGQWNAILWHQHFLPPMAIEPGGATVLLDLDAEDAAKALIEGNVDGVFLMGDFASPTVHAQAPEMPGIRSPQFHPGRWVCASHRLSEQAGASEGIHRFRKGHSCRTMSSLSALRLSSLRGVNLHPALSDLLLEAATKCTERPGCSSARASFLPAGA